MPQVWHHDPGARAQRRERRSSRQVHLHIRRPGSTRSTPSSEPATLSLVPLSREPQVPTATCFARSRPATARRSRRRASLSRADAARASGARRPRGVAGSVSQRVRQIRQANSVRRVSRGERHRRQVRSLVQGASLLPSGMGVRPA